jgi:hypothetical protein
MGKSQIKNIEKLQKDPSTMGKWAVENGMKINPGKGTTTKFTRNLFKKYLGYSLGVQKLRKRAIVNPSIHSSIYGATAPSRPWPPS